MNTRTAPNLELTG